MEGLGGTGSEHTGFPRIECLAPLPVANEFFVANGRVTHMNLSFRGAGRAVWNVTDLDLPLPVARRCACLLERRELIFAICGAYDQQVVVLRGNETPPLDIDRVALANFDPVDSQDLVHRKPSVSALAREQIALFERELLVLGGKEVAGVDRHGD